ncbi:ribonuclease domain-containing protein [Antrihabitans spumae]|uniref:Ribonuclease domain-containing protein n=1 Tax=Antrihabitans spumae TaxID=3373370 RepID=A0ABW7KKG7_9NOCA
MNRSRLIGAGAAAVLVVVVALLLLSSRSEDSATSAGVPTTGDGRSISAQVSDVPAAATQTLQKIDAGSWPESANAPGTKGGETWRNRDRQLPVKDAAGKAITYKEWDVNPKRRGQTRDAERIVTGSDGSAWYTGDHYKTFTRMR